MSLYTDSLLESKEVTDYRYFKENYKNIIKNFKYYYKDQVHFSQVDSFNVVHNIAYLYWLEWARTQYLFEIGLPKSDEIFKVDFPLMTVNSNIDYFSPLKFTDEFKVFTKISKLGNSSLKFYNIILNNEENLILRAYSTLVYVDKNNSTPIQLPEIIIDCVNSYELLFNIY